MSEKRDLYQAVYPVARFGLDRKYVRNVQGVENIPDGPALFAPNHIRFEDSMLVAISYTEATGKPLRFGAKQEYFDGLGIDNKGKFGRSLRLLMERTHQIPVERENPRAFPALQRAVKERVDAGDSVALHPEGTRSDDGRLHKFKAGIGRIAIALSVPIVPTGLVYTAHSNSRKTDVDIIFGEPIMPEETFAHLPYSVLPIGKKAEHLMHVVENSVADLTGMEQSHTFAVLKKLRHQKNDE